MTRDKCWAVCEIDSFNRRASATANSTAILRARQRSIRSLSTFK